jgi:hypothetical protein
LKNSSATFETATERPLPTGRSSGKQPSPISVDFALGGPSNPPDPATHAYRKDLADIALAGRVIASHYAEPLQRIVSGAAKLRSAPSDDADIVRELKAGEGFAMLDNSVGWAWGYAGEERLVGYVRSEALQPS